MANIRRKTETVICIDGMMNDRVMDKVDCECIAIQFPASPGLLTMNNWREKKWVSHPGYLYIRAGNRWNGKAVFTYMGIAHGWERGTPKDGW